MSSNSSYKTNGRSSETLRRAARCATHSNLSREHAQLRARHEASRFQLVTTELDMAITFCQVAADAHDRTRSDRNVSNANEAYAAATHLLNFLLGKLTPTQIRSLREKVAHLEFLLEQLHIHRDRADFAQKFVIPNPCARSRGHKV